MIKSRYTFGKGANGVSLSGMIHLYGLLVSLTDGGAMIYPPVALRSHPGINLELLHSSISGFMK